MRKLRIILGIKWSDYITNNDVLKRANIASMYILLRQSRLHWLGHVRRMGDGSCLATSSEVKRSYVWHQVKEELVEKTTTPAASPYQCRHCGRDYHSRIGLHSHFRRCPSTNC